MSESTRVLEVAQEIVIDASPERVFRALTDPAELPQWWTDGDNYGVTAAEVDLREGGRYRLTGTSDRLGTFEVTGTYEAVEPPNRLVYTWEASWDDPPQASLVAYRLDRADGGTRVRVLHTGFGSAATREEYANGWPTVLQLLAGHLSDGS